MDNNAVISIRLKDLLNILDARAFVTVYISETEKITGHSVNVYELLADTDFIKAYGGYSVKGLIACGFSSTNILITKERI